MEWNPLNLRKTSEVSPGTIPWKDPSLALVRLHEEAGRCEITYARDVGTKKSLLDSIVPADCVLVAWPGQHKQDVFVLDSLDDARAALFAQRHRHG